MEEEIWKDIPGWDGLYQASNQGNIRSLNYNKRKGYTRNRKPVVGTNGYLYLHLCRDNKPKRMAVHRLVAITFIPKPYGKDCIDHINGIRDDNRVSNLRWCTHSENINNPLTIAKLKSVIKPSISQETRKKLSESSKGRGCIKVVQLSKSGEFIREWECAKYAGQSLGKSNNDSNISACCRGRLKSAYGFKWMYLTDYKESYEGHQGSCN